MGVHHLCIVTLSCKLMVQHKNSPSTSHWDCIFDERLNWRQESTTTAQLQANLLTPMDRAMLFNTKSTISHCPPSLITRQRASVDSKLLQTQRNVGYYHIFERYSSNSTWSICCLYVIQRTLQQIRWQIEPIELMPYFIAARASTVEGETNSRWSVVGLIDPS